MNSAKVNADFSIVERGVDMEICATIGGIKFYTSEHFNTDTEAAYNLGLLLNNAEAKPCKT